MGLSLDRLPGPTALHLCIDMQRLFAEEGPWPMPWMERILPNVVRIVERSPQRTIFTRFVPPNEADDMPGMWRRYYQRWRETTLSEIDPRLVELLPDLRRFVPPAAVFDKPVYSAFAGHRLQAYLREAGCEELIVTGGESDICVLATVLGAVDAGYAVHLVSDALCSSTDSTYDAVMTLFRERFSQQVAVVETAEILASWPG